MADSISNQNKILITGATGKLGFALFTRFSTINECIPLSYTNSTENGFNLDLTEELAVDRLFDQVQPDIIIHTAALTDVDFCEEYPEKAYSLNVLATKNIVKWISEKSETTKIIYISTDHIYSNEGLSAENDVNPINVYALTKLWGEDIVSGHDKHLIVRTNFFGLKINGIVNWVIESAKNNKEIFLFDDIYFNPLHLATLTDVLVELVEKDISGTYNLGSSGLGITKAEFIERVASAFNLSNKLFKHCNSTDVSFMKARRPKDMRMNISAIQKLLDYEIPDIESSILKMHLKRT
ncbi:MAG: NAD(P)-dependent oxidoreductase [Thermodesulfobacteriota bacterium]|nr:MAG: NAD(P)-dependent oxidoreductase [Thermodesulfobacteriota bacterium]